MIFSGFKENCFRRKIIPEAGRGNNFVRRLSTKGFTAAYSANFSLSFSRSINNISPIFPSARSHSARDRAGRRQPISICSEKAIGRWRWLWISFRSVECVHCRGQVFCWARERERVGCQERAIFISWSVTCWLRLRLLALEVTLRVCKT